MKKIFIVALFAGTGIILSCTKALDPQPTTASAVEHSTTSFRKDIGTAD